MLLLFLALILLSLLNSTSPSHPINSFCRAKKSGPGFFRKLQQL
jgi:hypothetical protein